MALFEWFGSTKSKAYDRGIDAFDQGRYPEAIEAFEECLETTQDTATRRLAGFYLSECYANLGHAALKAECYERAVVHLEAALQRHPNYADLHYALAFALRKLGRIEDAMYSVKRALSINPKYSKAIVLDGLLMIDANREQEGLARISEALELDQCLDSVSYANAIQILNSGERALALKMLESLTNASAEESARHTAAGDSLLGNGKFDLAASEYLKALSITPNYPDLRCKYGLALLGMGRASEALRQFESALEINPNYADAKFHLSRALIASNRRAEAAEALNNLLADDPEYPGALDLLKIATNNA